MQMKHRLGIKRKEGFIMWLGIKGYTPKFHKKSEHLMNRMADLPDFTGKHIKNILVMWNKTLKKWYADAPVIIETDSEQLVLCADKLNAFSMTLNNINVNDKIEPFTMQEYDPWYFEWRIHPEAYKVVGQQILYAEIMEYKYSTSIIPNGESKEWMSQHYEESLLHGIGFRLNKGYFCVYNAFNENGIRFEREERDNLKYTQKKAIAEA